jgi:taurine dioxygenase
LKVVPVDAPLGAEVSGVDLTKVDDALFGAIREAWLEHLVLVFRNQKLTDNQLMEFSQRFGQLDEVPIVSVGQKPRDNKYISVVSNIVENGVPIGGLGDEEVFWHSDTSYRERPPSASVLHCLQVPNWGGDTGFSNMYLALESFDPAMRRRVETLQVKNDTTYTAGGQLRAGFEPITDLRKSPARFIRWCAPIRRPGSMRSTSDGGATPISPAWKSRIPRSCSTSSGRMRRRSACPGITSGRSATS